MTFSDIIEVKMETTYSIKEEIMGPKEMYCCNCVIIPRVNTRKEPYIVFWKCPKCGKSIKQIINGSNLAIYGIAQSINIERAILDS
jgi:Zn finger protein HypA/HybF involved in hydrogenase expression